MYLASPYLVGICNQKSMTVLLIFTDTSTKIQSVDLKGCKNETNWDALGCLFWRIVIPWYLKGLLNSITWARSGLIVSGATIRSATSFTSSPKIRMKNDPKNVIRRVCTLKIKILKRDRLKSESKKGPMIQNSLLVKKNIVFVQSSWNLVKIITRCSVPRIGQKMWIYYK